MCQYNNQNFEALVENNFRNPCLVDIWKHAICIKKNYLMKSKVHNNMQVLYISLSTSLVMAIGYTKSKYFPGPLLNIYTYVMSTIYHEKLCRRNNIIIINVFIIYSKIYYHDDGDNNVLFWRKEVQFVAGRVIRVPRGLRALLFSRCPRDCCG